MEVKHLLKKTKEIFEDKMTLSEIIPAMGKIFGDICRWQRNAFKDRKTHTDAELKKEMGNMILSSIRWCDSLGYDPQECINLALKCQKDFVSDIILVDEDDNQIGTAKKMQVHEDAKLHRAFSIFVFNDKKQMMLQKRAASKYHCPGLWTNTCCSHPKPGEETKEAAHRRLKEEMGFDCNLEEKFSFVYRAEFDNGLAEHEYDHVFFGSYNKNPVLNKDEADDFKWIDLKHLKEEIEKNPDNYTPWLKIALNKIV